MKKANSIVHFLSGVTIALLVISYLNTALAASGKVSYNFSNVALNGETKITAGADITAANGQKVPGTILFTDAAGGKTNYLPIRTVSELLGVEIGYDSTTKTVLLGDQPIQETAISGTVSVSDRQWQRQLDPTNGGIHYAWPTSKEVQGFDEPPAWRPTWLPEGYMLYGLGTGTGKSQGVSNSSATWIFAKDETSGTGIRFTCYRPTSSSCGSNYGVGINTVILRHDATVQGRSADFYQIRDDCTILVWEDTTGDLFWLQGTLDQLAYEKIANSVKEVKNVPLPALRLGWMPEGFLIDTDVDSPMMVKETWAKMTQIEGQAKTTVKFNWYYSREALLIPTSTPESVSVNSIPAQYWPGNSDAKSISASANGEIISITTSIKQMATLFWMDPDSKINFRIDAPFDRDTMIRMAESISPK